MGFVITVEPEKCTGCRMCEVGCSLRNMGECNPERSRIRVIREQTDGQLEFVPSTCMQCETAMCELVCPNKAISRDDRTGARLVDTEKCIGCSSCAYACPFGACFVDRKLGHSVVCSQCEGDPTCAKICPSGALTYVSSEEVNVSLKRSKAGRILEARHEAGRIRAGGAQ